MTRAAGFLNTMAAAISVALIGGVSYWLLKDKALSLSLLESSNPIWYLIRSAGITAYALLTVSVIWGLFLTSHIIKNWSPGPLSMMLHSTISWLALLFGFGHGLLLMFDNYVPYRLNEILVPFIGPYRPLAVGLGTLAFWFLLIITLSFPLKRRIGHRAWKLLHLTSYLTYLMVLIHGLAAGTDSTQPGFRIIMAISVGLVLTLSGYRVGRSFGAKGSGASSGHRARTIAARDDERKLNVEA